MSTLDSHRGCGKRQMQGAAKVSMCSLLCSCKVGSAWLSSVASSRGRALRCLLSLTNGAENSEWQCGCDSDRRIAEA